MTGESDVIVIGYGKVPTASASHSSNDYFAISMRVDPITHVVAEVDSTAVIGLVRRWIAETLTGIDLSGDIHPVLAKIDRSYLGNAAGSIKQAVNDAWRRYASYRNAARDND